MVFKNLCILVLWTKVVSALIGLNKICIEHHVCWLYSHCLPSLLGFRPYLGDPACRCHLEYLGSRSHRVGPGVLCRPWVRLSLCRPSVLGCRGSRVGRVYRWGRWVQGGREDRRRLSDRRILAYRHDRAHQGDREDPKYYRTQPLKRGASQVLCNNLRPADPGLPSRPRSPGGPRGP